MQAVVLAGGLGTRLQPLTYEVPKPMVSVLGKPFLHYIIEMLKERGIDNIVICSGYLADSIRDYFGNGNKFGVKITHSIETSPLGTAGAIRNALFYLKDKFFVINGDTYLDIDYKEIYEFFEKRNESALMVLYEGNEIKNRVDNVTASEEGIVTAYDKGKEKKSKYGWAGVLMLRKGLVEKWPSARAIMFEDEIFPELIEKKQMASFAVSKRYYDIGTEEKLKTFEDVIKKRENK